MDFTEAVHSFSGAFASFKYTAPLTPNIQKPCFSMLQRCGVLPFSVCPRLLPFNSRVLRNSKSVYALSQVVVCPPLSQDERYAIS